MSTTDVGNEFRDQVCAMLRTKYPDAEVERRINGTKVDVYFTAPGAFSGRRRFAVECKDYNNPLTKHDVAEIRMCYEPMQSNRHVDEVLIVSRRPLNDAANEFMREWHSASHRTFDELAESLLGIRPFIEALAQTAPVDGPEYIEARFDGAEGTALASVEAWIRDSEAGKGLAIRGSYGQGKTSFANRLAALYAQRHLDDPAARIPILHRLGTVVHETRLEALFGAKFTGGELRTDFGYRTFEYLNAAGRLLVILDGFDEMKHAMSAHDFESNFQQFNRLLTGHAKVILLGRPTAMPEDTENLVFKGRRDVAGQQIASSEFLPWRPCRLAYFTEAETRRLLTASLAALIDRHRSNHAFDYPPDFLESRVNEILGAVEPDLLKRPVHVNIVAELGANPAFNFAGFNEYLLYDHFIREMVSRDIKKKARQGIPLEDRLKFQRELAWWSWSRFHASQGFFFRREIPSALVEGLSHGNSSDDDGKLNEYIVSTLTEEKQEGALFFAHRSFQEFLVADRARLTAVTPRMLADYSDFLTPDVLKYLEHAPDDAYVIEWYEMARKSDATMSHTLLTFMARYPDVVAQAVLAAKDPAHIDPWSMCVLGLAWQTQVQGAPSRERLVRLAVEVILGASPRAAAAAAMTLLMMHRQAAEAPVNAIVTLFGALLRRVLERAREVNGMSLMMDPGTSDFAARWLCRGPSKAFPSGGSTDSVTINFDLGQLEDACARELMAMPETMSLRPHPYGSFYPKDKKTPSFLTAVQAYLLLPKHLYKQFNNYLYASTTRFHLTEVTTKTARVIRRNGM